MATVEFAIGSLVIFLLVFVAAEIGHVLYSYHTLVKSVRAGSRHLSTIALNPASVIDIDGEKREAVGNLVVSGDPGSPGPSLLKGLTSDDVEISWKKSGRTAIRFVRVSATFEYRPLFGSIPGFGFSAAEGLGVELRATSTMPVSR